MLHREMMFETLGVVWFSLSKLNFYGMKKKFNVNKILKQSFVKSQAFLQVISIGIKIQ